MRMGQTYGNADRCFVSEVQNPGTFSNFSEKLLDHDKKNSNYKSQLEPP